MFRGVPTWLVIGLLVLVGIALVTWITGKPPGITGNIGVTASNPNANPLSQPSTAVLV